MSKDTPHYPKHITKLAAKIAKDLLLLSENLEIWTDGGPSCEPLGQPLKVLLSGDKLVVKLMDDYGKKHAKWTLPSGFLPSDFLPL